MLNKVHEIELKNNAKWKSLLKEVDFRKPTKEELVWFLAEEETSEYLKDHPELHADTGMPEFYDMVRTKMSDILFQKPNHIMFAWFIAQDETFKYLKDHPKLNGKGIYTPKFYYAIRTMIDKIIKEPPYNNLQQYSHIRLCLWNKE